MAITGTSGNDTLYGTGVNDTMYGYAGNDWLYSFGGNDLLFGGGGNDILNGGPGNDIMYGGSGNDTYFVTNTLDKTIETSASHGWDTVYSTVNQNLGANLERLILQGNLAINGIGNSLDNIIFGNAGNNWLGGSAGSDILKGGAGNDTLDGGAGNDTMNGGENDDTYFVNSTLDKTIETSANHGWDTVYSTVTRGLGAHFERLILQGSAAINGVGNSLNNILVGNAGDNWLGGSAGNDVLIGGGGNDTLNGGTGNDHYFVTSTLDQAVETSVNNGWDTVYSSVSYTLGNYVEKLFLNGTAAIDGSGNDTDNILVGNSGDNSLYGYAGNDILKGEGGNDTLDGGMGHDTMLGGAGDDKYYVDSTSDIATETSAADGTDSVYSSVEWTLGGHIENLYMGGGTSAIDGTGNSLDNEIVGNSGNNTLSGGTGNDTIQGNPGNDTLYGNDGNDHLTGGSGIDTMYGGAGDDTYVVDNPLDVVSEIASSGTDTVYSSVQYELGNDQENLYLSGTANITGFGNSLNNHITGNSGDNDLLGDNGDDIIEGGAGNDRLYGNAGSDTLLGGIGNDLLYGHAGTDTMEGGLGDDDYYVDGSDLVTEYENEGIDEVHSEISYTLGDHLENLVLAGSADIDGTGNSLDNHIKGNNGNNTLMGSAGNDQLIGYAGNDTLYGGDGNDNLWAGLGDDTLVGGLGDDDYFIGSVTDVITESANSGTDKVYSDFTYTLGANLERLQLNGTSNINGHGNSEDNFIYGNSGNNIIGGDLGNDWIYGRDGADTFIFNTALNSSTNRDRIVDFSGSGSGEDGDNIELDQSIFTVLSSLGTLSSDNFRSSPGGTADDSDDYILYNTSSGILSYDADGNGSGVAAVEFAILTNQPTISASDFTVIA